MKNIFAEEFTKENEHVRFNGEKFVTKKVSESHDEILDSVLDKIYLLDKKASIPFYVRIIEVMLLYAIFKIIISIMGEARTTSIQTVYENRAFIFYFGIVCTIVLLTLVFIEFYKGIKVYLNKEYIEAEQQSIDLADISIKELDIPENYEYIDVLIYKYYKKGDKQKPYIRTCDFINFEYYLYKKENRLCFADSSTEISIPISLIKSIEKVEKRTKMLGWNKEDPYSNYIYHAFKVSQTETNPNIYNLKRYYKIIIEDDSEEFEIYIPNYDIEKVANLIGKHTDEQQFNYLLNGNK